MITLHDSGIESASSPEMKAMISEYRGRSHKTKLHPRSNSEIQAMSRTHQYRTVMKPLLERKRRARINKCLDELKDIMVSALQAEGESITKLEKADILELTVKHLHKLKRQDALGLTPQATYAGRFKAGYAHCAQEVSKFMTNASGLDVHVSTKLLSHLNSCIQALETMTPSVISVTPPPQPSYPPHLGIPPPIGNNQSYFQLEDNLKKSTSMSPEVKSISDCGKEMMMKKKMMTKKAWRPW